MEVTFTTLTEKTVSVMAEDPHVEPAEQSTSTPAAPLSSCAGSSSDRPLPPHTDDERRWHGFLPPVDLPPPRCVAKTNLQARPGYAKINASEFLDSEAVLQAKLQIVAALLRQSKANVIYSGAGLSTAAGIGDYASRAANSLAPHKQLSRGGSSSRLSLQPTLGHHVCAALESKQLVCHWIQQNHDRLAQKAGFPQDRLNEIHGAWGDMKNPVLSFNDSLRKDLNQWMCEWISRVEENSGVCLALGTSLCGMSADEIARTAGLKGLVIVGLSPTSMDNECAVRIWGVLDDVMMKLAQLLRLGKIPNPKCLERGKTWQDRHPNCRSDTPMRKPRKPAEWAQDPTIP